MTVIEPSDRLLVGVDWIMDAVHRTHFRVIFGECHNQHETIFLWLLSAAAIMRRAHLHVVTPHGDRLAVLETLPRFAVSSSVCGCGEPVADTYVCRIGGFWKL